MTISYIIPSSGCLLISYTIYRLMLRNNRSLQQRLFLMASIILSVVVPVTKFSIAFPERNESIGLLMRNPQPSVPGILKISNRPDFLNTLENFTSYVYIAVSLFFVLLILLQVIRILQIYKVSERSTQNGTVIFRSNRITQSFSFFGWIFIPLSVTNEEEIQSIIIHESIHARQYHSLDNLIIELICAFTWFNPVIWMIKKSLHLVHEYLADEGTLNSGIDKIKYQALLVNQAAEERLVYIPSGFNNNLLKKRMMMMKKTNANDSDRVKLQSLIPLPVILLITTGIINGIFPSELKAQKQEKLKEGNKEITATEYHVSSNSEHIIKSDSLNYIVDGVIVKRIDGINPDSIESVNVLKEDRTIIVRTKSFARKENKADGSMKFGETNNSSERFLYIVDGKNVTKSEAESISSSDIETMDVVHGRERIRRYTSNDEYNGVILITTKK